MNLEKYLVGIKKHKEKRTLVNLGGEKRELSSLTAEFGMYDNYTILMNSEHRKICDFLKNKEYSVKSANDVYSTALHPLSLGSIQLYSGLENANLAYLEHADPDFENTLKQLEKVYNLTAIINPNIDNRYSDYAKPCSIIALDLIECIEKNKIPSYLPCSMGWAHMEDLSRVVIYKT